MKIEHRLQENDANHLLMLGMFGRLQESLDQLARQVRALVAEFASMPAAQ